MHELIDRLVALKTEAEAIRDKIETEVEGGEIHGAALWQVCRDIDSAVGALMVQAYRAGNLTFGQE
jgi:hypothetical protein